MGAWGHGNFDNDDASDWLYELESSPGLSAVEAALDAALGDPDAYLEAPECCNALAAAEIVAALGGRPGDDLPELARALIDGRPSAPAELVGKARSAVSRIGSASELRELWEEGEDYERWRAVLDDLGARLPA